MPFQRRLARLGGVTSLAQALIKLTAPGVPDIYQGSELWQLSLVDPDNRRPVDWPGLARALAEVERWNMPELLAGWADGRIKLALIRAALAHRRSDPELYAAGDYQALALRGERRQHALAFARLHEGRAIVVAVPRRLAGLWSEDADLPPLGPAWRGLFIEVPRGRATSGFRNLLTGESPRMVMRRGLPLLPGDEVFAKLPVALLLGE